MQLETAELSFRDATGLRRERKKDAPWIRMLRRDALIAQDYRCFYCLEPMKQAEATADHDIPLSRGGSTTRENIRAADEACNKLKGHLTGAEFIEQIEHPAPGCDLEFWFLWSRRHFWLRVELACKRIMRSVT